MGKQPAKKSAEQHIISYQAAAFKGPIPPPAVLREYNTLGADFAERILRMAEEQQQHRITCETKLINESVSVSKRGQWLGFVVAVFFGAASVVLGLFDHEWLGGVLGGGTIVSLVAIFARSKSHSH